MNLDSPEIVLFARGLIAKYGLTTFIETGTAYAKSLQWAIAEGLEAWSCDCDENQVREAGALCPTAHLYFADSVTFLREVCPIAPGPALFWLDAHDPNQGESVEAWPVADELRAIYALRDGHDVILCDDMGDARADVDRYCVMMERTHEAYRLGNVLALMPR